MPEAKKAVPKPEPPALADGSTATDPTVHYLLARRDTLLRRDRDQLADIALAQKEIKDREADHAAIDAQLAELGYK